MSLFDPTGHDRAPTDAERKEVARRAAAVRAAWAAWASEGAPGGLAEYHRRLDLALGDRAGAPTPRRVGRKGGGGS